MGYIIQPECSCGCLYKEFLTGSGMDESKSNSNVPFYCEVCEEIKIRDLYKKISPNNETTNDLGNVVVNLKCWKCKNKLMMCGGFNQNNLDTDNNNFIELILFNEVNYTLQMNSNYCPKCKTNNLKFSLNGIWD